MHFKMLKCIPASTYQVSLHFHSVSLTSPNNLTCSHTNMGTFRDLRGLRQNGPLLYKGFTPKIRSVLQCTEGYKRVPSLTRWIDFRGMFNLQSQQGGQKQALTLTDWQPHFSSQLVGRRVGWGIDFFFIIIIWKSREDILAAGKVTRNASLSS